MIIRPKPTTLNTSFKKQPTVALLIKQLFQLLIFGVILVNVLVVAFDFFLKFIGKS